MTGTRNAFKECCIVKAYDFDVTLTCRHDECDDFFKDTAKNELLKLSKFHKHIIDGNIILDKENSAHKAEVTVRVPGSIFTGTHVDFDRAKALDGAVEKAKRQIQKLKSRIADHRPHIPTDKVVSEFAESETEE